MTTAVTLSNLHAAPVTSFPTGAGMLLSIPDPLDNTKRTLVEIAADPTVDGATAQTATTAPDADKVWGYTAADSMWRLYPISILRGVRSTTIPFKMGATVVADTIDIPIKNAATILTLETDSGFGSSQSFTVAASISGVAITGASLNVTSGTAASTTATAANTLPTGGGKVRLTFSNVSTTAPTGGQITLSWQE